MKKRWLCMGVVGLLLIGFLAWQGKGEVVTVTTAEIFTQRVEQTVTCTGVVECAETTGVYLPIGCVIRQVCVKEGERVEQGDVLAVMNKPATLAASEKQEIRIPLAAMEEEITAPGSGVVVAVNVVEGSMLEKGIPCVLLALEQDIQVRIGLREKDLQKIRQGMAVRLFGDGFSRSVYSGTISEISAAARTDTGSGTVVEGVVKLDAGQQDASLRLGLSARATVVTAVTERGLLVPHEAVLNDGKGYYVYLLSDGFARRKDLDVVGQVAAGMLLNDRSLEGKTVICNPAKIPRDGAAVMEEVS